MSAQRNTTPVDVDLTDLGALQDLDPRLVALAHGEIDDVELEELLERAVQDPQVCRAVEAYWPLDDEIRTLSFARARKTLETRRREPPSFWQKSLVPAGFATFVLTTGIWMGFGMQPEPRLPPYQLEIQGGLRKLRSAPAVLELGQLAPTAPLQLVFRPQDPVQGVAEAALFEDVGGHELRPVAFDPEISASGSVRWRGDVQELLPGRVGEVKLVLAITARGTPPTAKQVRAALDGQSSGIRLAQAELFIEAEP